MRAVVQRVSRARVTVSGELVGSIGPGVLVLVGVTHDDAESDALALADKVCGLRIFSDDQGQMNLSVVEVGGEVLVVSQFTLYGDVVRGRRPSFAAAARPEAAQSLIERLIARINEQGLRVAEGRFGAVMEVDLVNQGPVTILLESKNGRLR